MGRGGGCLPSKSPRVVGGSPPQSPKSHHSESAQQDQSAPVAARESPQKINTIKVYIIYYSMYGHVEALAKKVKDGVDSVEGTEGILFRVAETLSQQVLEKMHAPPKNEEIPIITSAQLTEADAFLFGFPTRYGAMAAQMKAFFDTTGGLWQKQSLAGKPAGFFVSTGTQGGGQETTAWTAITQLVHHGMLFVPIGYTYGAGMFKLDEIRGGSPYGAGTYAGDGSRLPSEDELALAEHQGRYTAGIVKKLIGTK